MEYFTIADKYFLADSNFQSLLRGDWSQLFISGTDKSLLFFKTLQRDRGASKLKFFKIGNESFLAIVNLDNVGQETVDLVIYKWRNNSFDKFSEIPPTLRKFGGAASFAIKNKTFISFRGYSAGGEEVSGTGFSRLQTIQTYEARGVKSFQMNGQIFLAIANWIGDGRKPNIFKWNRTQFVSFQSLFTIGAIAWHPFVMYGQTFLGLADTYGT